MGKKNSLSGCLDTKAFTLIELLVVVLIIGILAAVALPQYQKAVEKSRATQALTLLRSLGQAVAAHQLATGGTPSSFDELDVDMSAWTGNTKWADNYNVLDTRSNDEWSLQLYKDSGGAMQLYLGRLSGKYRGGGFNYQVLDVTGQFTGNLLCGERISEGIIFEQSEGAYCKGILGATPFGEGSCRWYKMPQ